MGLLVGFFCSAVGFTVQWREQWLPHPPSEILPEQPGSWFHAAKNVTTEWVRADAEWWSKFFCFVILVETLCLMF